MTAEAFQLVLGHLIQCSSQRSKKVSQQALVCHGSNQGGNSLAKPSGGTVEVDAFQLVLGHLIQWSSQRLERVSQWGLVCHEGSSGVAKTLESSWAVDALQLVLGQLGQF